MSKVAIGMLKITDRKPGEWTVDDLEHLAFDDASHPVHIGAALAFDLGSVGRLASEQHHYPDPRQHGKPGHGSPIPPVGQEISQGTTPAAASAGRVAHLRDTAAAL